MRPLSLCALLCVLPCVCRADDAPPAAAPAETVIRLRLRPAAPPTPALRYQLLPELREMNPGNPVQGYLICFMEQTNFYHNKTEVENREKWQTAPLQELPLNELRDYGGAGLRQADFAARLDRPDWQILLKLKRDGYFTLLPDVQQMRQLAAALKVRLRAEVAEGRFDDALGTAKTMFALSRCLGEHPTFIGELVGAAVATLALGPVEEMIQQPGCPNLYWALTDLPSPFIDLRAGRQGERDCAEVELGLLDEKEPMSDARLKQALDHFRTLLTMEKEKASPGAARRDVADWLGARAADDDLVRAARKRLVESGLSADGVKRFPAAQVILLDEKREFRILNDDRLKWVSLPYWEVEKARPAADEGTDVHLFTPLTSAVLNVRRAAARLDQRLALLRCVEALRAYAAEHEGKLPGQLADVRLPLPVDPISGKPFSYRLDGDTATLHGATPAGMEKDAAYNVRYEITVQK